MTLPCISRMVYEVVELGFMEMAICVTVVAGHSRGPRVARAPIQAPTGLAAFSTGLIMGGSVREAEKLCPIFVRREPYLDPPVLAQRAIRKPTWKPFAMLGILRIG